MAGAKQQRIDPRDANRAAVARPVPPKARAKAGAKKNSRPAPVKPATPGDWIRGARPQTLALAISPVALGWALSTYYVEELWTHWLRAVLCLVIAFALQIGVNFANDYSDGIRGVDGAQRQGPRRLVGSGAAKPRTVLTVAFVFFGIAAAAGLAITIVTQHWWLLAVGAVAIVAAWFYTGGKRPYGYLGLGEVVVFVFFGLVATVGTAFVLSGQVPADAWVLGSAAGAFACAVLMSNNLRDRERDAVSGKRTLAVLLPDMAARIVYVVLMLAPYGILAYLSLIYFNVAYAYFTLLGAVPAMIIAVLAKTTAEHLTVLRLTVLTSLVWGLAVAAAIAF
ncbi:1,4-dihydroxy-2-naphthoate polyprenyltransferase [Homoserinibacter sp. YIM 151385]|uniref:1,4-dihydroxy-2-naphthoate polyprenyltransferase n=1 Tax=Homoserinibacter sp. YIM 151385 TaxID=2985506 RepID=UPI0022F02F4F|nr:1,4-dihydroxy-2-naphthoate polyprenyltransferase [Homoserinibacter sp. YIM 151385]WBU37003.1 1,4-dihydroxy-2-naphthoate polyprenyltransferase [Homoserinibacter sp. YIM 151385]